MPANVYYENDADIGLIADKKVAILGYGVNDSSKQCAASTKLSFEKYPSAQVVFFDDGLQFAQADLSNADLRGADFKDANLQGTILRGADLRGARNLTVEQLRKAIVDSTTKLPEGFSTSDLVSEP